VKSLADIEAFLRARLADPLPGPAAQRRFTPSRHVEDWAPDRRPDTARHAAALVLLYPTADGPAVPLTIRHRALPTHAGQVSLPGGAIDAGESVNAAALREAEEEIGVTADHVKVLGPLSTVWVSVSNFVIHPVIGISDVAPAFQLHPHEVEGLIEAPVSVIRDRARLQWTSRVRGGTTVEFPYFDVAGHTVWGATAIILGEFACLFDADHAPRALH
jgi:8-oxo-dGTP pyrophosphatase MutT (NUDIX family)